MKKKGRGCSEEVVSGDGSIACVKWYDNKCVALASNYIGIGKSDKAYRFDKLEKQKISIDRPQIDREYNTYMGGVDLMNQFISYYRTFIRSKKWALRMISHFVDFAVVQCWIENKNECQKLELPKRQVMDLLAFRMNLAKDLVHSTQAINRTGRLNMDDIRNNPKNNGNKNARERRTDDSTRYDQVAHVPTYTK